MQYVILKEITQECALLQNHEMPYCVNFKEWLSFWLLLKRVVHHFSIVNMTLPEMLSNFLSSFETFLFRLLHLM